MPKTTKSKFSLNKLNYYAMFDTGDKLDHICVMLEKIVDDLDGQDVVKVEIDNKDNTPVRIFADQERDQLREENGRLREQLRWHSMDELPKRMSLSCMNDLSENVILRKYIGHDIIAYYSYWKKCWQDLYTHKIVDTRICHKWCYIPDDNQGTDCTQEGE